MLPSPTRHLTFGLFAYLFVYTCYLLGFQTDIGMVTVFWVDRSLSFFISMGRCGLGHFKVFVENFPRLAIGCLFSALIAILMWGFLLQLYLTQTEVIELWMSESEYNEERTNQTYFRFVEVIDLCICGIPVFECFNL